MNLYHNPTPNQLQQMIAACDDILNYYDILVDNDGEVFIRHSADSSIETIRKYKFWFRALLRGKHSVGEQAAQNRNYINQLYNDLIYCRDNNMLGRINYDEVSRVRHIVHSIKGNIQKRETRPAELSFAS
ncbi:MAG TPA: hypothetical protein VJY62_11825 [Bacteroidia bacterium]|nr:hypothetical protein [Bacteroidia bacterium]